MQKSSLRTGIVSKPVRVHLVQSSRANICYRSKPVPGPRVRRSGIGAEPTADATTKSWAGQPPASPAVAVFSNFATLASWVARDGVVASAGDVWVKAARKQVGEARSTLGGGQGLVMFHGMAGTVRTPTSGPPHGY